MSKILVIHSNQKFIQPETKGTNKPIERANSILAHLSTKDQFCFEKAYRKGYSVGVHSHRYLHFLLKVYESWEKELCHDEEYHGEEGLIPLNFTKNNQYLPSTLPQWRRMGFFADDQYTPITKDTYDKAMMGVAIVSTALEFLDKYQTIYCLTVSPGHHAHRERYGGYCFINNAAVCAVKLLKRAEINRVVILDLDYHHGNGTQEIFHDFEGVMTVSIHIDPSLDYPTFTGYSYENNKLNYNYPLCKGATWQDNYCPVLEQALNVITQYDPQILIVAFGGDTVENDPDSSSLGGMNLQLNDYMEMGSFIRKKYGNHPIIVTQEGGYRLDVISVIVENFLSGLNNKL